MYIKQFDISLVNEQYIKWMNDSDVNRFLMEESRFIKFNDLLSWVTERLTSVNDHLFSIHNDKAEHIGNIKLSVNNNVKIGDIGLLIGEKKYWGKGYARFALNEVNDFASGTLSLNATWAAINRNNKASINLFQSCGYQTVSSEDKLLLHNVEFEKSNIYVIKYLR